MLKDENVLVISDRLQPAIVNYTVKNLVFETSPSLVIRACSHIVGGASPDSGLSALPHK